MSNSPEGISGGLLVLFEGIDGAGKTTQRDLAHQALERAGWNVRSNRYLGGTPIGEALREVTLSPTPRSPLTDFYISVANQVALAEVVDEDRKAEKITLLDRGPLSFAAYHIYGAGVDEKIGWPRIDEGMDQLKPDLVILYDASLDILLERAKQRSGKADYFESKPREYFERVQKGYEEASKRYSVHRVDASQPIEAVHELTMEALRAAIEAKHKHC
jgi:dTMP kinase